MRVDQIPFAVFDRFGNTVCGDFLPFAHAGRFSSGLARPAGFGGGSGAVGAIGWLVGRRAIRAVLPPARRGRDLPVARELVRFHPRALRWALRTAFL